MKAIALARRHQAIAAYQQSASPQEVAQTAQVSVRTIRRWVACRRATGSVAPRSSPGRPPRIPNTAAGAVAALVEANPQATLASLCAAWGQETGRSVSPATMSRTLKRFGWIKRAAS